MDELQRAKDGYKDAKEYVQEQYNRIYEDFCFSNPSEPEQWPEQAKKAREGRPMHTLDRTNKYVQHVVNRQREAKTSADILPADSKADPEVAKRIKGIIRHIEYVSRADIAWDTASDHQARGGLGWVRVLPKMVNPELNEQEIVIQRVHDPLSCMLNAGWVEPDGSDATEAYIETTLSDKQFEAQFPGKQKASFDTEGWFGDNFTRILEYMRAVETTETNIVTMMDGQRLVLSENEYKKIVETTGIEPPRIGEFKVNTRKVKWCKLSGAEILEETEFPSGHIGLVPVVGHEIWIKGKRYLCGLVRRLMDGQRLHNYEMSALTESLMTQPKAPFLMSDRAVEGHEDEWAKLNSGNPAYLQYRDLDENNNPIAPPMRLAPPNFPIAYANTSNMAVQEMEESVGMPRATFGQQSNAVSGRAKLADQTAGETATFHFADNRRISQQQVYKIVVDMLPRIYNPRRQAKILGEDGQQSTIEINTEMDSPTMSQGGKIVAINPGVGRYDVRVKIGPSYTTIREELGVKLQELGKGNPVLAAALTPILMKLSDMPEADKISRIAIAMLPPEVQKAYSEEDDIPPAVKVQLVQQEKKIEQMSAVMDQAGQVIQDLQEQVNQKNDVVQAQAKLAMEQIQSAKNELDHQAELLVKQEQSLQDAKRIAQLELQLESAGNEAKLKDMLDSEKDEISKQHSDEMMQVRSESDKAVESVADAIIKAHEQMAQALAENSKAIEELRKATMEVAGEVSKAKSSPKTIVKDASGNPIGIKVGEQFKEFILDPSGAIIGVQGE